MWISFFKDLLNVGARISDLVVDRLLCADNSIVLGSSPTKLQLTLVRIGLQLNLKETKSLF